MSERSISGDAIAPEQADPAGPSTVRGARVEGLWQRHDTLSASIYWLIHAACLLGFATGVGRHAIALCLGLFWLRLFGITAEMVAVRATRLVAAATKPELVTH